MQAQLVGDGARDERAVGRCRVAERGYLALQQMLLQERPVVLLRHAFQHHPHEVIVRHNHAGLGGEALQMLHSLLGTERLHQAVARLDGQGLVCLLPGFEVSDGDVCPQAHYLVAHLVLEAYDHGHGDNHHGQAHGNAPRGDEHRRSRHLPRAFPAAIDALCDKEFPVHF